MSKDDYTPTDSDVKARYAASRVLDPQVYRVAESEFEAWLAEHDAKVRAETLREFAHSIPGDVHDARDVADLARGVADHIEKEAGLK